MHIGQLSTRRGISGAMSVPLCLNAVNAQRERGAHDRSPSTARGRCIAGLNWLGRLGLSQFSIGCQRRLSHHRRHAVV